MLKQLLAAVAALTLAAPIAARAQEVPSYAAVQSDQQIQGRVTGFDGAYDLTVADDSGYTDNIELHDGTIINPTGLELAPGMIVNILGYNAGQVFDANEIDTPYTFDNAVPYYAGHPWNYYGRSFGLTFFFGNTTWWHRAGSRDFSRGADRGGNRGVSYNGGPHVNNVAVHNTIERSQPVHLYTPPQTVRSYAPPATGRGFSPPARVAMPMPVVHGNPSAGFGNRGGGSAQFGGAARGTHEPAPSHERR